MPAYIGEIAAFITAFSWAMSSQFHASATRLLGVGSITLLRIPYNIALLLFMYLILRPAEVYSLEAFFYLLLASIFGICLCDTSFYKAVAMIGPRLSCLVQSTSACITAFLAYLFLGESIGLLGALGIGIAVFGVFFVLADGGNMALVSAAEKSKIQLLQGAGLAFFSAVMLALSLITTKQAMLLGVSPLGASIARLSIGGVILCAFFYWKGWLGGIWKGFRSTPASWKFMLAGGFFTALGVWASSEAVNYTAAGVAATIMSLEPVLIIPINAIYEKRRPSLRAVFGTLIAFVGIAILIMR